MKLKDTRENYYYFSQKTSEIVRQLGFAGIALIWIFRTGGDGKQTIPSELIPPIGLIVIGLTFDLLQYIAGALSWGIYNRYKEKIGTNENREFLAPRQINWPTIFFFWAKTIAMVTAYIFLFIFLRGKLF
jgi:hypothetical protein